MRIAILNLPIDSNYGGNLQRYALITILQRMGHEVEHIQLYKTFGLPLYKRYFVYFKRVLLKLIGKSKYPLFYEKGLAKEYEKNIKKIKTFYFGNIPHTKKKFYTKNDIESYDWSRFDAFIVGSDQVWRLDMTTQIGLENYFFNFLSDSKKRKMAYAVSFGNNCIESKNIKLDYIKELYKIFSAVSTREDSGLDVLKSLGMVNPQPCQVLDPTLLLDANDYRCLTKDCIIRQEEYIFCYVLDMTDEKKSKIEEKAKKLNLHCIYADMDSNITIEEWLSYIDKASYVITDSYHGTIFSIIFKKKALVLKNHIRGEERFASLYRILNITNDDFSNINFENMESIRKNSFSFIKQL